MAEIFDQQALVQAGIPKFLFAAPIAIPQEVIIDAECYFGRPEPIACKVILSDPLDCPTDYKYWWMSSRITREINLQHPDSLKIWALVTFIRPKRLPEMDQLTLRSAHTPEEIVSTIFFPGAMVLKIYNRFVYPLYHGKPVLTCNPPCIQAKDDCLDKLMKRIVQ
jgi:hypothetical protein